MAKIIKDLTKDIDNPINSEGLEFLHKGKIRIIIINEDMSYSTYFRNLPKSYMFTIKRKNYIIVSKAILQGKNPTIIYFFNNPCPLFFEFQKSDLSALDLRTEEQINLLPEDKIITFRNTILDAESLNIAFTTHAMKGIYSENNMTARNIIIILVVVCVIVLVFLQIFGVVDIIGMINGGLDQK